MNKPLKSPAKTKAGNDLFGASEPKGKAALKVASRGSSAEAGYTAADIEVLEGLEPVRRRPGMYIGGTDEKALHHLFAEVIDNSMDEALAGHATFIEVELGADGFLTVTDNGRGIPVDPHPKFPKKSALEVIMCTLHSGGKFDSKVYETSGGLHGVGVSVVNALSSRLEVEVARGQKLYRMAFERGQPKGKLEDLGKINNRRGTRIRFKPDSEIFGAKAVFKPQRLFKMARSKAYLFGGVEIRWRCDPALLKGLEDVPAEDSFHFPGGLKDYLAAAIHADTLVHPDIFSGKSGRVGAHGACEWAVAWTADADGFMSSYTNTVPTPDGGTHESGMRSALLRGLKDHAERGGQIVHQAPGKVKTVLGGHILEALQERGIAAPADFDAAEQIGLGARHLEQALRLEDGLGAENLAVRLEADSGAAAVVDLAEVFELALGMAALERHAIELLTARDLDLEPRGQRVDHRDADAV